MVIGRLAPTPSGALHLGNICAFAAAWLSCKQQQGKLLLRIEDLDRQRAAQAHNTIAEQQRNDLKWLGFTWDQEVMRQSVRLQQGYYNQWITKIAPFSYFCGCSRRELKALQAGGKRCDCININNGGTERGGRGGKSSAKALRFDLCAAAVAAGCDAARIKMNDRVYGEVIVDLRQQSDPVLVRADGQVNYNLAVVVDDISDGVTEVVRGSDLLDVTAVQQLLYKVFDSLDSPPTDSPAFCPPPLPQRSQIKRPTYLHSPLIMGGEDRKLSKSHGATHIGQLRSQGYTQADIWRQVLPWLGIFGIERLEAAVQYFNPKQIVQGKIGKAWGDGAK